MKTKFRLCLFILFCLVIFTSTVQAVDQVYNAIVHFEGDTPQLMYRTTVRPWWENEKYIIFNLGKNYNEWITDYARVGDATQFTYSSEYLIFTKEKLATYTENNNSYYGYYEYGADAETGYLLTSESIADFETWWNNVRVNSKGKKVDVEDKYLYDFEVDGEETTKAEFTSDTLGAYMNNILNAGSSATLPSYYYAPYYYAPEATNRAMLQKAGDITFTDKLVPYEEARRMFYNPTAKTANGIAAIKAVLDSGSLTDTMYVSDILVSKKATNEIINYVSSTGNSIYVSAISSTLSWSWSSPSNVKMYMITPENFLHAKDINTNVNKGANWSYGTLGRHYNGERSGLNLWDNVLLVEAAPTAKTIVINHVLVKEDGTFEKIDRQEEVSLYVENKSIKHTLNADNLYENKSGSYFEKYKVNPDITDIYIKSLKELDSNKIWTTETGFEMLPDKYDVKGYAIYEGSSIDALENEAETHGKYKDGNLQYDGNLENSNNNVVVNVYYTAPSVDIEVRHYCIKTDDGGGFNLSGNGYGIKSNGEKYPYNSTLNGVEYYTNVSRNDTITFERKNDLDGLKYLGYDFNKDYLVENATSSVDSNNISVKIDKDTQTMENDKIIIIFKYEVTSVSQEYKETPKLDINGTLSIQSINGIAATCVDTYSVPTNAKNDQNDIYVGIKQIPNYILAGMNVEQLEHKGSKVDINITIKFGPNSKTWTVEVPYYLSYYFVENLMLYKFDNATIYNTKIGADTYGEKLFASTDNKRIITPTQTSALTLWAVNTTNVINNDDNTGNWKNYLKALYKTNNSIVSNDVNPDDNYESKVEYRRNETLPGYYGNDIITLNHEDKNYSINSYIGHELSNVYKEIALDKSANLTIELLSEDVFNKINSDNNNELDINDFNIKKANTDNAISAWRTADTTLKNASENYKTQCNDIGYGYDYCYDKIVKDCESKTYCYEDHQKPDGTWECHDERNHSCGDSGELVCVNCGYVSKIKEEYDSAVTAESTARTNVNNLYSIEQYVLQNIDEAMYIQYNLWDVYKNYTAKEIVGLLDLDIKFEYSSGGAKLDNVELLTVTKQIKELDIYSSPVLSNPTGDKLVLDEVSLEAPRQTLTETQKSYYTKGIKMIEDITSSNYSNNTYTIPLTMLNGTRRLAADAKFVIDSSNIVGQKSSTVYDNMYYDVQKGQEQIIESVYRINTQDRYKYYGATKKNSDGTINSQLFNIYVPLVVNADVNQDIDVIDQTTEDKYKNVDVIQANSNFTINLNSNYNGTSARKVYTSNTPSDFTERYLNKASYYIKFEFDIDNVKYKDYTGNTRGFGTVRANTWIGPIYGDKLQATARINTNQGESVTDTKTTYYVIAVAVNAKDSWTDLVIEQIETSLNEITDETLLKNLTNNCGTEGGNKKISYYASTQGDLVIVNRMYDFRVTDVKDVDWKNVFRQNESSTYVNSHSGIAYYAGLSKWNTEDPTKYNEIIGRTEEEVGTSPTRILPVGPYKNTNKSYVSAPKMGYRFSFDVKVTGAPNVNKYVTITPRFYYISKDGKTYYSEYNGSGTGIYLFYKNSQGQYVRIGSSQDKYQIQFVPNDGYRALIQAADINLSKNNIVIGDLKELTLPFKTTTTYSDNDSAITYYGEYKLPNSTIAVKVENGKYNINAPLSNGYIGVVFDIYANESNKTVLSYSQNSYIPASKTEAEINTSQWDYEGYLGITKPGEEYSTTLRLEKGTWQINNEMYNKIKGTVMLYDLDNKASNDFN